jgi:hypothetical protein
VGDAKLDWNLIDARQLHDREIAFVVQPEEGVKAARHAVHVKQRDERAPHHIGKERDVLLDVGGHEGEVMKAARMGHDGASRWAAGRRGPRRGGLTCVLERLFE